MKFTSRQKLRYIFGFIFKKLHLQLDFINLSNKNRTYLVFEISSLTNIHIYYYFLNWREVSFYHSHLTR